MHGENNECGYVGLLLFLTILLSQCIIYHPFCVWFFLFIIWFFCRPVSACLEILHCSIETWDKTPQPPQVMVGSQERLQ